LRRVEEFAIDPMAARLAAYYEQLIRRWRHTPEEFMPTSGNDGNDGNDGNAGMDRHRNKGKTYDGTRATV
jgi:hypothetical protein